MSQSQPEPLPSVTESPWFWVMLFSLAGLAAVFTVGPKFERREAAIETSFHARERALGRELFEKTTDDSAPPQSLPQELPWRPIFTLGPIVAILMCIAMTAMFNVFRIQRHRLADLRRDNRAKPPADGTNSVTGH